ncbi:uncharacterized protein [Cherax quadricarinatus]|uniref:uncharacterized protein n=1 Tax=Cherax quadricarinatus TaxID=27406 RepID=UPI00387EA1D5
MDVKTVMIIRAWEPCSNAPMCYKKYRDLVVDEIRRMMLEWTRVCVVAAVLLVFTASQEVLPSLISYKVATVFPTEMKSYCKLEEVTLQVATIHLCAAVCLHHSGCLLYCLSGSKCTLYNSQVTPLYVGAPTGIQFDMCYSTWNTPYDLVPDIISISSSTVYTGAPNINRTADKAINDNPQFFQYPGNAPAGALLKMTATSVMTGRYLEISSGANAYLAICSLQIIGY